MAAFRRKRERAACLGAVRTTLEGGQWETGAVGEEEKERQDEMGEIKDVGEKTKGGKSERVMRE